MTLSPWYTSEGTVNIFTGQYKVSCLFSVDQIEPSKKFQSGESTIAKSGIHFASVISLKGAVFFLVLRNKSGHLVKVNGIELIEHGKYKECI